jgi:AmpE protein
MKLIAILIAFAALKYLPLWQTRSRYAWYVSYANKMQTLVAGFYSGWVSCIIIILPLLIALVFVQEISPNWAWGLIGFVISVIVLWYCLWPVPSEKVIEEATSINEEDVVLNEHVVIEAPASIYINKQKSQASRLRSETLLTRANEKTFAVLFWFIVLGALGALLYRSVSLLRHHAQVKDSRLYGAADAAQTIQAILDWIPARLTAFTYILAGDFVPGFSEWRKDVWSDLRANATVLIRTGLAACGYDIDNTTQADEEENRSLLRMVERALIVWLVLTAIFTLGAWIY